MIASALRSSFRVLPRLVPRAYPYVSNAASITASPTAFPTPHRHLASAAAASATSIGDLVRARANSDALALVVVHQVRSAKRHRRVPCRAAERPQATRGWTHPPCGHFKIQSCCCLCSAFEAAFQTQTLTESMRSAEQDVRWTYQELSCKVLSLASALKEMEYGPGEKLLVVLQNGAPNVVAQLAAAVVGCVSHPHGERRGAWVPGGLRALRCLAGRTC
jgi:hypothetical protein